MSSSGLTLSDLQAKIHQDEAVPTCKGQVYRYTEGAFNTRRGFGFSKKLSLLKRKSCSGCNDCWPQQDDVEQGIADLGFDFFEFSPTLKDGDIVELQFVVDSTDWELGYVDTWHYKVVKIPVQNPTA